MYKRCFTAQFGEAVVYHPRNGSARRITVVVQRDVPTGIDGVPGPQHGMNVMQVEVMNDPDKGISSNEIDLGGDRLEIIVRIGGESSMRPIGQILSQDDGTLLLEVR